MAAEQSSGDLDFGIRIGGETSARPLDPEAPFRIGVLGDFSGRANRGIFATGRELGRQQPVLIDRDNFDEILCKLGVGLTRLLVAPDEQPVTLKFQELDDFDPDALFDKLDLFASLRGLRRRLSNADTFAAAAEEVMGWSVSGEGTAEREPETELESARVPETLRVDQLLDQLLEEAQLAEAAGTGHGEVDWQRLIAEIAAPYAVPAPDRRQDEMVRCVDAAIQATMVALLQHPSLKQLEADWRALRQLVFELETDVSLKVYLIDVSQQELAADVLADDDLTQTGTYQLLVEQTVGTPGGQLWGVLVGACYFGSGEQDVTVLGRLAKIAAAAGAPLVAGAEGGVVGCPRPQEMTHPDDWRPVPGDAWESLRKLPEATYLGLVWPRFLVRLPYGRSTRPTERFDFEEIPTAADSRRLLWGNSAFLCARLLGQAFTRSGWNMNLDELREINELPVWIYEEEGEQRAHPCGELLLADKAISRVSACGVMPLISLRDQSAVRLGGFQSIRGTLLNGRWR